MPSGTRPGDVEADEGQELDEQPQSGADGGDDTSAETDDSGLEASLGEEAAKLIKGLRRQAAQYRTRATKAEARVKTYEQAEQGKQLEAQAAEQQRLQRELQAAQEANQGLQAKISERLINADLRARLTAAGVSDPEALELGLIGLRAKVQVELDEDLSVKADEGLDEAVAKIAAKLGGSKPAEPAAGSLTPDQAARARLLGQQVNVPAGGKPPTPKTSTEKLVAGLEEALRSG